MHRIMKRKCLDLLRQHIISRIHNKRPLYYYDTLKQKQKKSSRLRVCPCNTVLQIVSLSALYRNDHHLSFVNLPHPLLELSFYIGGSISWISYIPDHMTNSLKWQKTNWSYFIASFQTAGNNYITSLSLSTTITVHLLCIFTMVRTYGATPEFQIRIPWIGMKNHLMTYWFEWGVGLANQEQNLGGVCVWN